jgi:3-hydroxyisobutyrate dehydrogenase
MKLPSIGFIGTGVMGSSMALHLLNAGHTVTVFNRTPERAASLLQSGADWADSPADLARRADIVITMVGYPADVEQVYRGPDGLFAGAHPGQLFIDATTSSPDLAIDLAREGASQGIGLLDAPVSGGDRGAREASLSFMVGGDSNDFERARPLFSIMGKTIVHQGPAGSGQYCKLCNQIAVAGVMLGVCEALAYAQKAGLNPETVLQSISSGAAGSWTLSNLAPRMLQGDFEPGFYVRHFIKDMGIALTSAQRLGLYLPGLELAERLYQILAAAGHDDKGTQALYLAYIENMIHSKA